MTTAGSARTSWPHPRQSEHTRQRNGRFIGVGRIGLGRLIELGSHRGVLVYLPVHHGDLTGGVAHHDRIVGRGHNGHTLSLIELLQNLQ